jgi:hypothetical protein
MPPAFRDALLWKLALEAYVDDPRADWYLRPEVSVSALVGFYRIARSFPESTVSALGRPT